MGAARRGLSGEPGCGFMDLVGTSDWIGLVCTPEHRAESELRRGGVGYESQIITRVLFEQVG